jgi:hypothetical protein
MLEPPGLAVPWRWRQASPITSGPLRKSLGYLRAIRLTSERKLIQGGLRVAGERGHGSISKLTPRPHGFSPKMRDFVHSFRVPGWHVGDPQGGGEHDQGTQARGNSVRERSSRNRLSTGVCEPVAADQRRQWRGIERPVHGQGGGPPGFLPEPVVAMVVTGAPRHAQERPSRFRHFAETDPLPVGSGRSSAPLRPRRSTGAHRGGTTTKRHPTTPRIDGCGGACGARELDTGLQLARSPSMTHAPAERRAGPSAKASRSLCHRLLTPKTLASVKTCAKWRRPPTSGGRLPHTVHGGFA